MSPVLEITDMTTLGNKTTMVMTPVYFFYLMNNWVTLSGNTYLSGNIVLESSVLSLYFLHIGIHTGDEKYRI